MNEDFAGGSIRPRKSAALADFEVESAVCKYIDASVLVTTTSSRKKADPGE